MYDTVCTLPLSSELFTQALHPTDTVLAVGLASGHVQTFRLPATGHGGRDDDEVNSGFGKVETQWRTRRHQGSCRSLTFSPDGEGEPKKMLFRLLFLLFSPSSPPSLSYRAKIGNGPDDGKIGASAVLKKSSLLCWYGWHPESRFKQDRPSELKDRDSNVFFGAVRLFKNP
jgi:hypothetical protein